MIISNNLIGRMPIPDDAIIRINLAWVSDPEEAQNIIDKCTHDIYLDYPSGRTKPPKPVIALADAIKLAQNDKVKYFAISNAENVDLLSALMILLPGKIIVPKIETATGVKKLKKMEEVGITTVMLDKEDLYVNVKTDSTRYADLLLEVYESDLTVLSLQGVVFDVNQ